MPTEYGPVRGFPVLFTALPMTEVPLLFAWLTFSAAVLYDDESAALVDALKS